MKISVVQHNPQDDLKASLAQLFETVKRAAEDRPDLIALPEYYAFMGDGSKTLAASGAWFDEINGQTAALAKTLGIPIHAGSLAEERDIGTFNTTVIHGADGAELARYSKIHLFDVDMADGTRYRESDLISPGSEVVTYALHGWTIGCAICYDLRFPELFRRLRDLGAGPRPGLGPLSDLRPVGHGGGLRIRYSGFCRRKAGYAVARRCPVTRACAQAPCFGIK